MRWVVLATVLLSLSSSAAGQTPQPFPRPGDAGRPRPSSPPVNSAPAQPQPQQQAPQPQSPQGQPPKPAAPAPADPSAPAAATVWFPVYPASQFLASYDAGRGQRYYLYGTTAPFADVV